MVKIDQAEGKMLENQLRDVLFVQVEDYDFAMSNLKRKREQFLKGTLENIQNTSLAKIDADVPSIVPKRGLICAVDFGAHGRVQDPSAGYPR
jgi:hypothetical protein